MKKKITKSVESLKRLNGNAFHTNPNDSDKIENDRNIYTSYQPATNLPCMIYSNSGASSYTRQLMENQFFQPAESPDSNSY